jgi:hypothetical protein
VIPEIFQLDQLDKLVKQTLAGADALPVLRALETENSKLKEQVRVSGPRGEGLIEVGFRLTKYARQLAKEAQKNGNVDQEEMALACLCRAILSTQAHRRELVGPTMLEWARCNKRMGNEEKADLLYNAIIQDFLEAVRWGPGAGAKGRIALQTLHSAISETNHDTGSLQNEVEAVLAKLLPI